MMRVSITIIFILIVFGLVGCNNASTLIKEVNIQELDKDTSQFVDNLKNKKWTIFIFTSR